MRYDVEIGGLPFFLATNQQNMYRRETADFRRQRVDQEREVGEQSLDSGYWLRSQASFHMGSGIASTEPLSVPDTEARFRFNSSRGVNPWTPGELSLLHDTYLQEASASWDNLRVLGIDDTSALYVDGATLKVVAYLSGTWSSYGITNPLTAGSTATVTSITSTGSVQYFCGSQEIAEWDGATSSVLYNGGTALSLLRWLKQRLIAADGASLIEVTDLSPATPPATLPAPFFTHSTSDWAWTDAAEGPEAIYVAGYSTDTSGIYAISLTENAGVLELGTPTLVVDMPRGERILSLYSYLGSYMIVGSNKGVRVAQIRDGGTLALGPLLIESTDEGASVALNVGCYDAVAQGRYVWVTVGDGLDNLWRIDLGQPLDGDLKFAVAADLHHLDGARVLSVTSVNGTIMFTVAGLGLVRETPSYFVSSGWLETGRIRMGTLQPKAWMDGTLMRALDDNYPDSMEARLYTSSESDGPWTLCTSAGPSTPAASKSVTGTIVSPTLGPDLYLRIELQPTLSGAQIKAHSPVVTGYQISSIPAPARSRLVSVPIQVWDWERDRNGAAIGHDGYAWERLEALEAMESDAAVVTYDDHTTGESREAYVERVTFTRMTPPFRGDSNSGGVAQVLLRLVA